MLFALGALALGLALVTAVELARCNRALARLSDVPPIDAAHAPRVSIVVAARNEARGIAPAMRSLLALDYPDLDVIAVDDHSTDGTRAILDQLAGEDPRLRVLEVEELPAGWLGKNHALHLGAAQARGELILFTDADVVMRPRALARAVHYLEGQRIDHLAILPRLEMHGTLLRVFGAFFSAAFLVFSRPWKARAPGRWHIGVGAFNLLRASVYRALGGHQQIRLRPDDDMKLGKLVKKHGYRQDSLIAGWEMEVEWYADLRSMVRGLRKNALAGLDYHVSLLLGGVALQLFLHLFTPTAAFLADGAAQALFATATLVLLIGFADHLRRHELPAHHAAAFPLGSLIFAWALLAALVYTWRNGGIEWRDRFYPLAELRGNDV